MTDSQLRTVDSVLLKEACAHQTGSACVFLCTCGHTLSHKGGGILGSDRASEGSRLPSCLWGQLRTPGCRLKRPMERMGTQSGLVDWQGLVGRPPCGQREAGGCRLTGSEWQELVLLRPSLCVLPPRTLPAWKAISWLMVDWVLTLRNPEGP